MAFRGNWPPKYRMMSTFWRSQPLLICLKKKQRILWRNLWCDHVVSNCVGRRLLFPKITQFENIKKRREFRIWGPFFPLFWKNQVIIDYLRRQKLDQAAGWENHIQADALGQRPFKGVSKHRGYQNDHFLVGKPHGFVGETQHFWKHPLVFFFVLKMVHAWCYELCYRVFIELDISLTSWKDVVVFLVTLVRMKSHFPCKVAQHVFSI